MPVEYTTKKHDREKMYIVEFTIPGNILDVAELFEATEKAPTIPPAHGVCISGRGPVWLYAALAHKYHSATFVATYDPRLNACIVIASHVKDKKVGDLIPL